MATLVGRSVETGQNTDKGCRRQALALRECDWRQPWQLCPGLAQRGHDRLRLSAPLCAPARRSGRYLRGTGEYQSTCASVGSVLKGYSRVPKHLRVGRVGTQGVLASTKAPARRSGRYLRGTREYQSTCASVGSVRAHSRVRCCALVGEASSPRVRARRRAVARCGSPNNKSANRAIATHAAATHARCPPGSLARCSYTRSEIRGITGRREATPGLHRAP